MDPTLNAKKTSDLDNDELILYLDKHVVYEFRMLRKASDILNDSQRGMHMNVFSESFAIHLRNLIFFFYPERKNKNGSIRPPNKTDVCAKHFFKDSSKWERIRPKQTKTLEDATSRANKEISHLTTYRQYDTPKTKEWDNTGLTKEIVDIFKHFYRNLDKISPHRTFEEIMQ